MQKAASWRELLGYVIEKPAERERIATEMGIRSITLTRWANGESNPRPQKLPALLKALPQQYEEQFRELFDEEGLAPLALSGEENSSNGIPGQLYDEVLRTCAQSPDSLRYWTISRQVLQHALRQLDPAPVGMAITLVRCMPPTKDGKIRSLHEDLGLGNGPWASDLEPKSLFLGAESLTGHVMISGHLEQIEDLKDHRNLLPAFRAEHEVSAAACPIIHASRIAGCLLCSSTQPKHFLSQEYRALIQSYTNLLALAFEPEEFYARELIELQLMPSLEVQRPYLASFRQRVTTLMREPAHQLNLMQAERLAWQQIEEILLSHPKQE